MSTPIEALPTQKSVIDLSSLPKNSFNSVLYGYKLSALLDDILLVKYEDETDDGSIIMRNGILVPVNADSKAWRVGRVILAGNNTKIALKGTFVIFPNNLGIPISNLEVEGYGTLKNGIFLNEQRIFGIAASHDSDESVSQYNKNLAAK